MDTAEEGGGAKAKEVAEKPADEEADLSEEDQQLKKELEEWVAEAQGEDASLHKDAVLKMRTSICAATSTMTSVPKPLKFLLPHYDALIEVFGSVADPDAKEVASDIVSLLAMTQPEGSLDCLKYRMTGSSEPIETWGHEYVRHLSGQIAETFAERTTAEPPKPVDDLLALVADIIPYDMTHSAEAEACDLAMEVGKLDLVEATVDDKAFDRVCLYLLSCVPYVPEPEDDQLKQTCVRIYRKFEQYPQAMQMALKLNDLDLVQDIFKTCTDTSIRRQLAFMLARQQVVIDVEELLEDDVDDDEIEFLADLLRNTKLNESFLNLARELDIVEPKTPEDIYKTHLDGAGRAATIDSAWANLAATFVNAFVNVGFGKDKLIIAPGEDQRQKWIYRNKDDRKMSAAASLGLLLLWDIDNGLQEVSPYIINMDENIKAGAILACGIINAGVSDENEPAKALLTEYVLSSTMAFRAASVAGLGMAYAGSGNEEVGALLIPALVDPLSTMEVVGATALALGQIYVGTCDGNVTEQIITVLMEKEEKDLDSPHAKFLVLGLGLLYLGRQAAADVPTQAMAALPGGFQKFAKMLLEICAYAGTGNVLKVQAMLHACSEHVDVDADGFKEGDDTFQAYAALGVSMIAMGEEVGVDMALRTMNNLLQYGEPVIKRAVPLAIGLLCVSNPKLSVLDTLSKLSHDADAETAYSAIFAIGLVGAGTNHARIGGMLRTLAQYYAKDPQTLFMVRVAQGILHAGKGSVTLSPFHTERSLMSPVAISGLLATLVSAMDMKNVILGKGHHMLYHLALAMYPRIFSTFLDDDELTPVNTSVRVGQAVDVVGQAGKPKTITGFVTSTTPVLLGFGDRAQMATEEYIALTPLLEGFVIVKKNPEWDDEE